MKTILVKAERGFECENVKLAKNSDGSGRKAVDDFILPAVRFRRILKLLYINLFSFCHHYR